MAQAPTVAVPKRIPLVVQPENRNDLTTKDARLVNCYLERRGQEEVYIYRRPGLLTSFSNTGSGYGCYNWKGNVYSIFGATMYKDNVALTGTLDTTGGVYYFSQCLGSVPKLVFGNGKKAYTYDSGAGIVQITDVDFPAAFVKGWAYLDGTTYVGTAAAAIQGSNINDPQAWSALNVLIAQIEPDGGVAVAKQLVYTIMFKEWSAEVFYDAANTTGSPLGQVQGAKAAYGCVSADSVQEMDDCLYWIAANRTSSPQVMTMNKLKVDPISTAPVERLLANADFTTVFSWTLKLDGHAFYVFTVKNANLTLAYDVTQQSWSQWTDATGNYLPIVASTFDSSRRHILQHESNGKLYYANSSYYDDDGTVITVDVYTPNFDAGVYRGKQLGALSVVADQVTGSMLKVRSNDADYSLTGWNNFAEVDLGVDKPMLTNEGTFMRRAYNLRHAQSTFFRLQALEFQVDVGTL